jgi:hypothetical protein
MLYKFTQQNKIQALFSAGPTVWTRSLTDLATASIASTCHYTGHAAQVVSALLSSFHTLPGRLGSGRLTCRLAGRQHRARKRQIRTRAEVSRQQPWSDGH